MKTMKKGRFILLLLGIICILVYLGGCGGDVSQEEYEQLKAENQQLLLELEKERETINAKLTGSFVATVRHLIPDYVGDDRTPRIVIMTQFQSEPFMLWLGEDITSQLEVGNTYRFVIEDKFLGEIPMEEFEKGYSKVLMLSATARLHVAELTGG